MNRIKLAVFDMAGTTVNENNIVYKTVRTALLSKGYKPSLEFVLKHGAGKEKHQAIIDILKALNSDTKASNEIFLTFQVLLEQAYQNLEVQSFEGVENLLHTLKENDIKVALNTGYNSITANLLLQKMNWKKGVHYDALVTADDVQNGRPAPDMIYKAMDVTGIKDASEVIKVGDSIIDIEEGKNAKCRLTIGVTTGAHTSEQLKEANPDYILDSLTKLKALVL